MDGNFTIGALGSIVSILGVGGSLAAILRSMRRQNEADQKAATAELKKDFNDVQISLTERLVKVETKITEFMPRGEIEAKIEHEKVNRTLADDQLRRITDNLGRDVRDIMIGQSKIEQQQADTASTVVDARDTLKELSREMISRFEKVSREISDLTAGHRKTGQINS